MQLVQLYVHLHEAALVAMFNGFTGSQQLYRRSMVDLATGRKQELNEQPNVILPARQ